MFNALGFGLASAVLLVTFGKLITDNWFSYLLVAIIQFELVMFWLGLKRPLGTENNDRYLDNVDSNAEQFRHDASVVKSSRPTKKHSKWIEWDCYLKRFVSRNIFDLKLVGLRQGMVCELWLEISLQLEMTCTRLNVILTLTEYFVTWLGLSWLQMASPGLKAAVITLHRCFDSSLQ